VGVEVPRTEHDAELELKRFADSIMSPGPRLTAAEITSEAGIDLDLARRLRRAMGLPDVPEGEPAFFEEDLEALYRAKRLMDQGLNSAELLHLARTLGLATSRMADAVVDFWADRLGEAADGVSGDGASGDGSPGNGSLLGPTPLDDLEKVVGYLLRRHLLDSVVRRLSATMAPEPRPAVAVGFADLVGFTSLSEQLSERDTGDMVETFELLATDVIVGGGGRVVKMIGDEVMFSAEPDQVGEIALGLAETFHSPDLPSVRVGVAAGSVVAQSGDLYGPVVNLAARATMAARPGTVLVSPSLAETLGHDPRYAVKPLQVRRLKGIGPTVLSVLRRAGDDVRPRTTRRAG
jgi:adenylate cyclase